MNTTTTNNDDDPRFKFTFYFGLIMLIIGLIYLLTSCSTTQTIHKNGLYGKSNNRGAYQSSIYYCGHKTKPTLSKR